MATPTVGVIDQSVKALARYQDGYRLARTISGLSQVCKVLGLFAGIFVVVFGVLGSETVMRPNEAMLAVASGQTQHNVYLISVILFGVLIALSGFIIGVIVDGYSQQLRATVDTAVNGSPFLSNSQRAQIMRLE